MVRFFLALAIIFGILGVLWHFGFKVGSLPGDISVDRGNTRFLLPIGSCILISILLSILLRLFNRSGP